MNISDLDYHLPKELIAQTPSNPRDTARLMVVDKTGKIIHKHFYDLPNLLSKNDCLVFNKTKVFPARIFGKKDTSGKVEVLLLKNLDNFTWEAITKPGIKVSQNMTFKNFTGRILEKEDNKVTIKFNLPYLDLLKALKKEGHTPLPPYIKSGSNEDTLRKQYQTVYAEKLGSAAAPTAGLHFTKKLLKDLKSKGIQIEYVTLHVGLGTFAPVKEMVLEEHKIHEEYFEVDKNTYKRIINAKKKRKRIIAVGTTTTRVLESLPKTKGYTNLFIYPPYNFHLTDGIITNFHLPKSTLLALIFAFLGSDLTQTAYKIAVKKNYKFFSFGDGMLLV